MLLSQKWTNIEIKGLYNSKQIRRKSHEQKEEGWAENIYIYQHKDQGVAKIKTDQQKDWRGAELNKINGKVMGVLN